MGSHDEELTVLVTGFGPFGEQQSVNPSWEIARNLPSSLPRTERGPRVRIVVHPEAIRVSYDVVRKLIPTLWDEDDEGKARIDAAIHIGMAGPRPVYQLERRARRDGYRTPDVDGCLPAEETCDDDDDNAISQENKPSEIKTDLPLQSILQAWRAATTPDMDLRISDDAGRFLCEYIYHASLAHLLRNHRPRNVLFLHVPCHAAERYVKQGTELAVALVRAVADGVAGRAGRRLAGR
ncbi:Peptidase C15, pyroglutamyl peptidase I-like protein [Ophiocordyceps camponoti-floridani]|uniref:Peptidase C15, pyroglutamyl peptidase I-like protein n=1 Tax=Ophiocordyceps camponoti-floridani TaxID=2030778 RepID=A0A8H4Q0R0_9HYPO|nr:Peptidase C15, pyroglutamyl peptidase I-like protein [Ophiocordyceps camponoti-floridani]